MTTAEETKTPEEIKDIYLKVVITVTPDRATVGVSRPLCDPYIISNPGETIDEVAPRILEIVQDAVARWEVTPQFPKYERPPPPKTTTPKGQGKTRKPETPKAEPKGPAVNKTLELF